MFPCKAESSSTNGSVHYPNGDQSPDWDMILKNFKVGVLCPVQQSGSYWDRSSVLPLVAVEPTQR